MAFIMRQMLGDKLKNMTGGAGEDIGKVAADAKTPESKMSRDEFEEHQRQMVEEKMERDKEFARKKADRANLRCNLRDKYRLPESGQDEATVNMAGDDIDLPEGLAKMVEEDEEEEEANDSFLVNLQNMDVDAMKTKLQNVDVDAMKTKAQTKMTEVKQVAEEKCTIM